PFSGRPSEGRGSVEPTEGNCRRKGGPALAIRAGCRGPPGSFGNAICYSGGVSMSEISNPRSRVGGRRLTGVNWGRIAKRSGIGVVLLAAGGVIALAGERLLG